MYVDLPDVGSEYSAGDAVGSIESVKAVSEIYAPISGTVIEKLAPGTVVTLVRSDRGWMLVAKDGKKLGFVAEMIGELDVDGAQASSLGLDPIELLDGVAELSPGTDKAVARYLAVPGDYKTL